jgi:hypothetical protein
LQRPEKGEFMNFSFSFLVIGFILFLNPILTFAGDDTVFSDSGGMPKCLAIDQTKHILFSWSQDLYSREIFASLEDGAAAKTDDCTSKDRHFINEKKELTKLSAQEITLKPEDTSVFGFQLSDEVLASLKQVRNGANLLRPSDEITAEAFLLKHPLPQFTVEVNRELTEKYGVGFVSELYKLTLIQSPANAMMREKILSNINLEKQNSAPLLSQEFKDYTVVIVYGYGYKLNGNRRFADLRNDLIEFGLDVQAADTDPFGDTAENSKIVTSLLTNLINQGRKIILLAGSVGGTEALGAVADVAKDQATLPTKPNRGSVEAVVNLSGIVTGSFLIDWATSNALIWHFVKSQLYKQFNAQGAGLTSDKAVDSIRGLGKKYTQAFYVEHPVGYDKHPLYLNVVGVTGGNGLIKDASINKLQDQAIRPQIKKGFGANDGYIEYPGTEVPAAAGLETYTVAFDASHVILDGSFEGISMAEKPTRQLVLKGMLQSIADVFAARNK